jgi:hypothetical protein
MVHLRRVDNSAEPKAGAAVIIEYMAGTPSNIVARSRPMSSKASAP